MELAAYKELLAVRDYKINQIVHAKQQIEQYTKLLPQYEAELEKLNTQLESVVADLESTLHKIKNPADVNISVPAGNLNVEGQEIGR